MTSPATFTITERASGRGRSVVAACDTCRWTTFGWLPGNTHTDHLTRDHADQHKPGRALDIEVEWDILADCSVCDDDGNVSVDDEGGLTCESCGTHWTIEGRRGTRDEDSA